MSHNVIYNDVEIEVLFRALDRPQDVKKLLSLELTGAWVNEAKEIPKGIIDTLGDRVGRYPAVKNGGCTWSGVIMDTNSPDDDHWWYKLAEESTLENWEFFSQPGGLLKDGEKFVVNPNAENLEHLPKNYYSRNTDGKSRDHILVYYCNEYGFVKEGRAIYNNYSDSMHCSKEILEPVPGVPIQIGIDFGLTPAATFGQKLVNGSWIVFDELVTENMGAENFSRLLKDKLNEEYPEFRTTLRIFGDPAGEQRSQTDEKTPFKIMEKNGIFAVPAATNDFTIRVDSVNSVLGRIIDGQPGFLVSPKCKILRKALAGGYNYKRLMVAGEEKYRDYPDKNKFSHPAEALQYMIIGDIKGGEVLGDMGQGDILAKQQEHADELSMQAND